MATIKKSTGCRRKFKKVTEGMTQVRDNAIQSSTMKQHGELINALNQLTEENNKQISDMDSKSLRVAEENENIINNKGDKFTNNR